MYSDAPRLTRAGLRSGGALSRAKDNITSRVCTTLAAALASPRPDGAYPARLHCYSHIQRSRLSGRPCKAVRATGTWPLMVARWSVRVFSFLFCRVTIESRSICAESRSILSSVEHGTFFGRFLCHSCHIRHRIRDPGYHRRGGGNRAWDSKRSDAGRDARRGRAMGARLWRHTPLTAFDRGRAASRVVSFELGVEVDHALPDGDDDDRRGAMCARPSRASAAR